MELEYASADIPELMDRKLKMDFQLSAFNGDIRGKSKDSLVRTSI